MPRLFVDNLMNQAWVWQAWEGGPHCSLFSLYMACGMAYCRVQPHHLMLEGLAQLKVMNMPLPSSTTHAPLLMQQAVPPYQAALPAPEQLKTCINYRSVHCCLFSTATFLSKHDRMTLLSVVARVCCTSACLQACLHQDTAGSICVISMVSLLHCMSMSPHQMWQNARNVVTVMLHV